MKCLPFVILSLCSPLISTQDYIDVVGPYPNPRPNHDRRAQSFLAGRHSPDTMTLFANMLYNYLKGVSVPSKNDDDFDAEEPHVKAKNLELVQDAFEKTSSLRRLVPPPSLSVYGVPPLPGDLPPPPPTFNDYEINAPAIPPVESDRPSPPVMPKFPPHRYNPLPPTPIPSTPPPPSRILLFRPSSLRKRPDEFIVRSPPTTQFNSPDEMRFLQAVSRFVAVHRGGPNEEEAAKRSKIRACIRTEPGGGCIMTDE